MSYISSIALCCNTSGRTIHIPQRITFSGVTVSSSLTFLNGATMSLAARRPFNVLSAFVALIISFNVMARGTVCLVTKSTYSSLIFE